MTEPTPIRPLKLVWCRGGQTHAVRAQDIDRTVCGIRWTQHIGQDSPRAGWKLHEPGLPGCVACLSNHKRRKMTA
jgi:hypothetical protein